MGSIARTNSSLESLWTTGHHLQMYRQLKAGRRVCRRELLEASAQPMAFSSEERERQPLLLGALTGGDASAAAVRGGELNMSASGCLIEQPALTTLRNGETSGCPPAYYS